MSDVTTYYMRVRGRIMGPFDQEKLQGLSRRGQLSRMHEVSTDGVTWTRAANFPELFNVAPIETPGLDQLAAQQGLGGGGSAYAVASPAAPAAGQQKWYYTRSGQEQGPVDFANLQVLAATGQLAPQELVWTEGMTAWTPAAQVAGLAIRAGGGAAAEPHGGQEQEEVLPAKVSLAAQGSRPWTLFLAISGFVFAALQFAFGVLLLIEGAKIGPLGGSVIFMGLMNFVGACVCAAGSMLLLTYANHLANLSHSTKWHPLERALNALRIFWIFVSIVLIVALTFIGMFVILVFSHAVSLPAMNFHS